MKNGICFLHDLTAKNHDAKRTDKSFSLKFKKVREKFDEKNIKFLEKTQHRLFQNSKKPR